MRCLGVRSYYDHLWKWSKLVVFSDEWLMISSNLGFVFELCQERCTPVFWNMKELRQRLSLYFLTLVKDEPSGFRKPQQNFPKKFLIVYVHNIPTGNYTEFPYTVLHLKEKINLANSNLGLFIYLNLTYFFCILSWRTMASGLCSKLNAS